MVTPSAGSVVLVTFPFSDLSQTKLRPAVVLARASRSDWVLSLITSKSYSDARAVELTDNSFDTGSLRLLAMPVLGSYLRETIAWLWPGSED